MKKRINVGDEVISVNLNREAWLRDVDFLLKDKTENRKIGVSGKVTIIGFGRFAGLCRIQTESGIVHFHFEELENETEVLNKMYFVDSLKEWLDG